MAILVMAVGQRLYNAPEGTKVGIAVTGGYVYRGSEIPELYGKYIFGDWSTSFTSREGYLLGTEEIAPGQWELTILDVAGGNPLP